MRSRGEILAEIADLEKKIQEYQEDLKEIEEILPELEDCGTNYEDSVVTPVGAYDITAGENWKGNLADEGIELFDAVITGVQSGMDSITTLLGQIAEVIAVIQEWIKKAQDRIKACYAELEALDAMESAMTA